MKNQLFKRLLALAVAMVMVLGMLPELHLHAHAEGEEEATAPQSEDWCGNPLCSQEDNVHVTSCAQYVAPENPVCYCVEKCAEPNIWCDVCGFDYTQCGGTDRSAGYGTGWEIEETTLKVTGHLTALPEGVEYSKIEVHEGGNLDLGEATVTCDVDNYFGTISSGTFNTTTTNIVSNHSIISGGTFHDDVNNEYGATISGGTFTKEVRNDGTISGGDFISSVINKGTITGGTIWYGTVTNKESGTISNAKFESNAKLAEGSTPPQSVIHSVNGEDVALTYNAALPAALGDANAWYHGDTQVTDGTVPLNYTNYVGEYAVNTAAATNGTVSVPATAKYGQIVTVTATAFEGYVLDTVTVQQGETAVTVTDNTFTMPAGAVTVTAAFSADMSGIQPGYYLVGILNGENKWELDSSASTRLLREDPGTAGQYYLNYSLSNGDKVKIAYFDGTTITQLFQADGKEAYAIDTSKEGTVKILFRPEGNDIWSYTYIAVTPAYNVTVNTVENGTVSTDKAVATNGETVTLTVTPAEGYELVKLEVVAGSGSVDLDEENYTFTMPAGAVTVTAYFQSLEKRTVYFDNSAAQWSQVNIFFWSDSNIHMISWPGVGMIKAEGNIYSCQIPADAEHVIFNNGSSQTNDQILGDKNCCKGNGSGSTWYTYPCEHTYENGTCTVCGKACEHTGGTATCTTLAVCDTCGESYGELAAHNIQNNVCTECGFTYYNLWVGGVQVNSDNAENVLGDGTVHYDADTQTLTLSDADISTADLSEKVPALKVMDGDITLVLTGENKLTGAENCPGILIESGASVTVAQDSAGSLAVQGQALGYLAQEKIYVNSSVAGDGDLTVAGGTVTGGIHMGGTITITGGTVNADFLAAENVVISGGTVTAAGQAKISYNDPNAPVGTYGIYADKDIQITGGSVTVSGGYANITESYVPEKISTASATAAMYAGNAVTVTGGTVTATGGEWNGYYPNDLGFMEYGGGYTEDGEGDVKNVIDKYGKALKASSFTISDEASFTCGDGTAEHYSHSYADATCASSAVCAFCGESNGEVDKNNHDETVAYENGFCPYCDAFEPAVLVDGVYQISNAGNLYWFADKVTNENAVYGSADAILTCDIRVNEGTMTEASTDARVWTPIGKIGLVGDQVVRYPYTGTFEGNGKTVSGLYYHDTSTTLDVGLFSYVGEGGTVRNVGIADSYLCGSHSIGAVVGSNYGSVTGCYNTGTVIISGTAGGVVGYNSNSGTVTGCYNTGTVSGESSAGGVVGGNSGTVTGCYNTGTVSGESDVGGVVGRSIVEIYYNGIVTNCHNTGTVSGTTTVGGVVGYNSGTATNCTNSGTVSGKNDIGGVVGAHSGTVMGCYNTGTVSGEDGVGGVVAYNNGIVMDCYHSGSISGTTYVGGVVGWNQATCTNCYFDSTVYTGNAIGDDSGTATNVEGKSTEQFASGEVAYLLSQGEKGDIWGQTIGTDPAPIFSDAKVYYGYRSCGDTEKVYTNNANVFPEKPEHTQNPTYTDNHDGTHSAVYPCCGTTVSPKPHAMDTATGKCVCGFEMAEASVTIGGATTHYEILHEAIQAVSTATAADNAQVKLLKSIDMGDAEQYVSSGEFTLDLNGQTLSSNNTNSALRILNATVTITDNLGGGEIKGKTYGVDTRYSTLTIMNATITATGEGCIGLYANNCTAVTIKGATISGASQGVNVTDCTVLTITDAAITATGKYGYGMNATSCNVLTITDTAITAAGEYGNSVNASACAEVTIEGGTFSGGFLGVRVDGGNLTITDAEITSDSESGYGVEVYECAEMTIEGGTIRANGASGVGVNLYKCTNATMKGTDITANGTEGRGVQSETCTLTIQDSAVTATEAVCSRGSEIRISGGSITGSSYDLVGTVKLMLPASGTGTTFPGGITVTNADLDSILGEGAAYWQGSKMIVPEDGQRKITGGDVTIQKACDHQGNTNVPFADNGDGTHSAVYPCCGTTVTEDHAMDTATGKCVCGLEMAEASVTIGGITTYYETLSEAISNVSTATADDNATVTLLKDNDAGQNVNGGVFTLDLNGKDLTSRVYGLYISGSGTNVTIADSKVGGEVSGESAGVSVSENSTVTISGGTVSGDGQGVYAENSTVTISGGTVSGNGHGVYVTENSTVTISSGTVSGSTFYGTSVNDNSTVTISGGTVSGGNGGVIVSENSTVEIRGGIISNNVHGVSAAENSTVTISGGNISSDIYGVEADNSTVTISGGNISSDVYGVYAENSTVTISGGSITGSDCDLFGTVKLMLPASGTGTTFPGGITVAEADLNSILGEGAAYWQGSKMIVPEDGQQEITGGDVTIQKACDHQGNTNETCADNGDGTHSLTCSVCYATFTEEHNFENDAHKCACGVVETFTYQVETYTMDAYGNYGEPVTEEKSAPYGTQVNATPNSGAEGFYLDTEHENSLLTATVPANNDLVLRVYIGRNQYPITWDLNGGGTYENDLPESKYFGVSQLNVFDKFVKEGYTFSHLEDASGNRYVDGSPNSDCRRFYDVDMPVGGLTLKAIWSVNTYALHVQDQTLDVDYGTALDAALSGITPEKTGHTFTGWKFYVDEGCTKEYTGTTMPASDLYAQPVFTPIEYNITWILNGCTVNTEIGKELPETLPYTGNTDTHQLKVALDEPAGYKLEGFKDGNGNELSYSLGNGYLFLPVTGDMTVEAIVTPKAYTATWESADGGSYEKEFKFGETITIPDSEIFQEAFRKAGHTLTGWEGYTEGMTMPIDGVTFTAVYAVNPYTITFDSDGGTAVAPITQDYGTAITAPSAPTKDGFHFSTWDPAIPETMPSEDTTLTAIWEAHKDYTYTASGDTITAFCGVCHQVVGTAKLHVTGKTYDATPVTATVTCTMEGVDAPQITYSGNINAGTYTASITLGDATAKADFTITPAVVTVRAEATSKIYGQGDPALSCTIQGLIGTDALSGSPSRAAGENAGSYAITVGTLANDNYTIDFIPANLTILPKTITVKADAVSKVYGQADPEFTYQAEGLVNGDKLTGELKREAGEDVGAYAITLGTLANSNYAIQFTGDKLTVTKAQQTITLDTGDVSLACGKTLEKAAQAEGAVTYSSSDASIVKVDASGKLTALKPGTVTITVKAAETGNYLPAQSAYTVTVSHGHIAAVTAPTCEAKGYTTYTCPCGDSYVADYTDALGHDYKGKVTLEATCTAEGVMTYTCENDASHSYTEVIPVKAHTPKAAVEENRVEATCTEKGSYELATYCGGCGKELGRTQHTIDATGHDYDDGVITTQPGCETEGVKTFTCANDKSHTYTEKVAPTGHSPKAAVEENRVEATCTEKGSYELATYCGGCGKELGRTQHEIPAKGHSFGSWTVVKAATCTEKGLERRDCSNCDHYETRATAFTGHSYRDAMDPSCEVCGEHRAVYVESIPMLRLYNPVTGEHHYTGSVEERDTLVSLGWNYEGVAWNAPVEFGDPVCRYYNPNTGDHHYTMCGIEGNNLVDEGWIYEGVAWNSASSEHLPIYRLYNPNAEIGAHHYTGSAEERDNLVAEGWSYEGIGWYALLY